MPFAGFFIDEDTLALKDCLPGITLHPGHPALPCVPRGTPDRDWLPIIGERRLILVTRDKRIRRRAGERQAIEVAAVRGFAITSRSMPADDLRKLFTDYAAAMQDIAAASPDGPWLYPVTRSGIGKRIIPPS